MIRVATNLSMVTTNLPRDAFSNKFFAIYLMWWRHRVKLSVFANFTITTRSKWFSWILFRKGTHATSLRIFLQVRFPVFRPAGYADILRRFSVKYPHFSLILNIIQTGNQITLCQRYCLILDLLRPFVTIGSWNLLAGFSFHIEEQLR